MKLFRRLKSIISFIFLSFIMSCSIVILCSCGKTTPGEDEGNDKVVEKLTLITINDFHGALEESNGTNGIARLASNFKKEADAAEASVIISAGDMFQGTALSNYDHGKTTIEIMNQMNFDLMVLGNHEFDWGYSEMYNYQDGNENNGEAKFPFLGCNIIEKATGKLPKGLESYQIIERGGLKIGIIGYMGYGNESDIAVSMIEDYYFAEPVAIISNLAKELRTKQEVDVVVVVGHEGNDSNHQLAALSGDEKIDAIVNAHTHASYSGTLTRSDGTKIPYVQAGSAGKKYGLIELNINTETKQVTGGTSVTKNNSGTKDSSIEKIVNDLKDQTAPVFGRIIGVANSDVERYGAADWAATALKDYAKTDVAVINIGGIRAQAFPIRMGENITVSKMYEIMPFDNVLKTVDLKGEDLKALITNGTLVTSANVALDYATGEIYINHEVLDLNRVYSVASIDYIFDNTSYPFFKGENKVNTGILFRDVLIQRVEKDQTIQLVSRGA